MNSFVFRARFLIALFILWFISPGLAAAAFTLQSDTHQTALIELYTSEGCSSCVPADERMSALESEKGVWSDFVPVAFHVSYWDYIGWIDRLASPKFTERQKRYGNDWGQTSIYTPCFVLNGKEWTEWLTARALPERKKTTEVGTLRATSSDFQNFLIEFTPIASTQTGYDVHVAILGFDLRSEVNAGENMGRTLHHNFVALDYKKAALVKKENHFQTSVKFEKLAASDLDHSGIAVWVSAESELIPIQAAGGLFHDPILNGVKGGSRKKK